MQREDYAALTSMGFEDAELKELGLWEPVHGDPADLAEMYVRRSKKKDTLSSIREQVRRMCAQAARDEVKIRRVWFEQKSASKSYVRREEFDNACETVCELGLSKTLYVFKTSRLSRRGMGQVGLLLDKLDEMAAHIYVVAESLDSRKSRMLLAILSEQAREQAADISTFSTLGLDAIKSEGKWAGGRPPYGLRGRDGKLEHDPEEYPTARRIAEYFLEGKTSVWIAQTLNSEGLTARNGGPFKANNLAALARSVSWAGLIPASEKVYDTRGVWTGKYRRSTEPMRDANGKPLSCGQGVITFAEHAKIQSHLTSRARKGNQRGGGKREFIHLGTSILRCGRCLSGLESGGAQYRCSLWSNAGPTACQGLNTGKDRIDAALADAWLNHVLSLSPESDTIHTIAREWLSYKDPGKDARKREATAELENAISRELKLEKEFFVLKRMSEASYDMLREQVGEEIRALKEELAALGEGADLTPLTDPEELADLWKGAGIQGQRALLKAALDPKRLVVVTPAGRGDRTPIMDRMTFHWREAADPTGGKVIDLAMAIAERTRKSRNAG